MGIVRSKYYGIIRGVTVGISFFLQIGLMIFLAMYLMRYSIIAYFIFEIVSVITVFALVNNAEAYKMSWIVIILVLPVSGLFLYFMWGRKRVNSSYFRRSREIDALMVKNLRQNEEIVQDLERQHPNKVQISRYLRKEGFPIYNNTHATYFGLGEKVLEAMLEDLKQAKKFIFMEYFIVSDGKVWSDILEVLTRKVKEGVEVKLLFDDFGTLRINTQAFRRDLKSRGIEMSIFNPIHRDMVRMSFNYRNHKKITVIDGNIGYTGGFNLADEYANYIERFGHWKDSGIRLYGDGVYSFTCFFLNMWRIVNKNVRINDADYRPQAHVFQEGYVQPFMGGPHRNPHNPTEGVYTRMINKARDYIYITTPYLVLDQSMRDDLTSAAQSGVDVCIIVPRIYDKWYVYMVNVSNYGKLMEAGVHIYEYKPGFIHAKNVIADDECAICGTINTDYRSFYLHYECGVFLSEMEAVKDMKDDFLRTLEECEEMDLAHWSKRPIGNKVMQAALKVLSPLL
ncbi:MAG: cardiolipin synthase [Lachnospiraceae bacterium]|jgi:cardiolipin synthase|nr:cardiolipin synthase [Lachnospiraceae bacterium A4]MCI8265858.1 cardiolipin synthase [Lachnospiraceae bacterium]